jgi:hypothetical protein
MDESRYYTEDEASELVEQLNALGTPWQPWKWTRARKEHTDWFGDRIEPGQDYLRRSYGPGFDECVKLSPRSVDLFLSALFAGNTVLEILGGRAKVIRDRKQADEMREALEATERYLRGEKPGADTGDGASP